MPVPLLQAQSHAGAHSNPVADALQSHYSKAVSSSIGGLGHGETAAIGRGYVNQSDFDGQGSGHDFNGGVSTLLAQQRFASREDHHVSATK